MKRNRRIVFGRWLLIALMGASANWAAGQAATPAEPLKLLKPKPLVPGEGSHALARGIADAQGAPRLGQARSLQYEQGET